MLLVFLTLWSSNLDPANWKASNTGFRITDFVKIDWFVINFYANPNLFQVIWTSSKLSIKFLPKQSKIFLTVILKQSVILCFFNTKPIDAPFAL